jgi:hypothetical protein
MAQPTNLAFELASADGTAKEPFGLSTVRRAAAGTSAYRREWNVEERAIFTLHAGSSVAWQRTCFGSRRAICDVGCDVLSAKIVSDDPPIIVWLPALRAAR